MGGRAATQPQYSRDAAIVGIVGLLDLLRKIVFDRVPRGDRRGMPLRRSGQSRTLLTNWKCHKRLQTELSRNNIHGSSKESKAKTCSQQRRKAKLDIVQNAEIPELIWPPYN
ncbi:hypothetical protein J6590_007276 [Homalodisca vitripennis]|nr:hypothetical protein J6590_007276 [Homalodisca vitripennis]